MTVYSYEKSELVLIGEVLKYDSINNSSTILISEYFKGSTSSDTVMVRYFDSCSLVPNSGRWLIYADVIDGNLNISECGPSVSFQDPVRMVIASSDYSIPVPPKGVNHVDWIPEFDFLLLKLKRDTLDELIRTINYLRKTKPLPNKR